MFQRLIKMVSVDDLVISLKIDEGSNLGKLQKQLEALVGPKGEGITQLGAGITPDMKRALDEIKADLMFLTPTVISNKETTMRAALALTNRIRDDQGLRESLLERYNIQEETLDEFTEELLNIANDMSDLNNERQKRLVILMEQFTSSAKMTEGERETLLTKILSTLSEVSILQKKVEDTLSAAGLGFRGQYQVYGLTRESIAGKFDDIINHYKETDPEMFANMIEIFKTESDVLRATEKALELTALGNLKIDQLDKDTIKNNDELRLILSAQVAAAIEKSNYMLEDFYKAGKELIGGKAFGAAGPKKLDLVVTDGIKDFFETHGGVINFGELSEDMKNTLTELKLVATKQDIENTVRRRFDQGFKEVFVLAEKVTQEAISSARELLEKEQFSGRKIVLGTMLPRVFQNIEGIGTDLQKLHAEVKEKHKERIDNAVEEIEDKIEEETEKIIDDTEELKTDIHDLVKQTKELKEFDVSKLDPAEAKKQKDEFAEFLSAWEEDLEKDEDLTKNVTDVITDEHKKRAAEIIEMRKALQRIDKNTEDTLNEVKSEKRKNEPKVEKDPGSE